MHHTYMCQGHGLELKDHRNLHHGCIDVCIYVAYICDAHIYGACIYGAHCLDTCVFIRYMYDAYIYDICINIVDSTMYAYMMYLSMYQ